MSVGASATGATEIHAMLIPGVLVGAAPTIVLHMYLRRLTRHTREVTWLRINEVPIISFAMGFLFPLFGPVVFSITTIPTVAGQAVMVTVFGGLLAVAGVAYYALRPSRLLTVLREALEEETQSTSE